VRRVARIGLGTGLALASALSMGALTRYSYTAEPTEQAELRLTWRARAAPVEECRRLTESEQEALPVHMRREVICEGRVSSYRLEVVVDGEPWHSSIVKGSGARGDRPLYVFDAVRLDPGRHDVHVVFEREGAGDGVERAEGVPAPGDGSERGTRPAGVPDRLELRERLELAAGEVALVTYDATRRRLVLRQDPGR
jgi:hypothetical protein